MAEKRKFWTDDEDATLRSLVGQVPVNAIASRLNRTLKAVYLRSMTLGLTKKRFSRNSQFDLFITEKHRLGWSATETAAAYANIIGGSVDRHAVANRLRAIGLQLNRWSEHQRAKVREKTAEQLRSAGLPSMAQLRLQTWARHARRLGWPDDLRPRAVQILHTLYTTGPMTRREICDATGMPWKGSRKSLHSNDPEGSYLANLMRRGLVVSMPRARRVTGRGKGYSQTIYCLPLHVQPQPIMEESHAA